MKPLLMCFDEQDIVFQGGKFDYSQIRPSIRIKIPEDQCRNDEYDAECVTTAEYDRSIS